MTRGLHKRLRLVAAASAASRMPPGILRAASLAALLLAVTSCGQTGPLTLPGAEAPAGTPTAPPADAADAEEDQTEQDER
jgi:predicted small lipoprotein YifL